MTHTAILATLSPVLSAISFRVFGCSLASLEPSYLSLVSTAQDFGWLDWLVHPLQLLLFWIADSWTAGNFGWAIVVATVLIRLCLWPLTHRIMRHARLMRQLNPRVQEIRKAFQKRLRDRKGQLNLDAYREMNEQVTAVYRQAGTSPTSGCSAMLLQSPVLIAFFYLLRDTPELQGAGWILWVQNLASADPYYLLPLAVGVTQLLQQLFLPMGNDRLQRRLALLVPLIFTIFCFQAPSGLVLYWLVSNLITLLQHWLYRFSEPTGAPESAHAAHAYAPSRRSTKSA